MIGFVMASLGCGELRVLRHMDIRGARPFISGNELYQQTAHLPHTSRNIVSQTIQCFHVDGVHGIAPKCGAARRRGCGAVGGSFKFQLDTRLLNTYRACGAGESGG